MSPAAVTLIPPPPPPPALGKKSHMGPRSTQLILGPSSSEEEEVVEAAASQYPCARLFSELGVSRDSGTHRTDGRDRGHLEDSRGHAGFTGQVHILKGPPPSRKSLRLQLQERHLCSGGNLVLEWQLQDRI